ncbi:hypothetical protein XELAEV_18015670mg [Xenopus laevis]|uniref:Uncharacterized protein n=1 Tax=Xenopus laevis TaxID=8355 RepID=A0A974HWE2_XENLA|nr:hypothetical protein XELAEV_18015670mg [Xenopus laevis]
MVKGLLFVLQWERLDSRGGFVKEQNVGLEGFVRVLFVEVELRKSGCFLLFVRKPISGIWKTVSIVHFFCAHCNALLFSGFFQAIQLARLNSSAMCTRFVPPASSSPH